MPLFDVFLPKKYKNQKVLFEQDLDAWRKAAEEAFNVLFLNLTQLRKDAFLSNYDYNNNGINAIPQSLQEQINLLSSGGIPITGTTSDTWTINTDGFSATISTAGLTDFRTFTFPDESGEIVLIDATQTLTNKDLVSPIFFGNVKYENGAQLQMYSDVGVTLKFRVDGATGDFGMATGRKFFVGDQTLSGDVFISNSAKLVQVHSNGSTICSFGFDGTRNVLSGGATTDIALVSGRRLRFDNFDASATSFRESAADVLRLETGGVDRVQFSVNGVELLTGDLCVQATKKIGFNGFAPTTSLRQSAVGIVTLEISGMDTFKFHANGELELFSQASPTANFINSRSGARGWLSFIGLTGNIQTNYNIINITRNGVGDYTIDWDTNFATGDYVVQITVMDAAATVGRILAQTPSQIRVFTFNAPSGAAVDPDLVHVIAFGDQ